MKLDIRKSEKPTRDVSEMILGHNIEMCLTTADGLLSDRIRNPKFLGPPHRMTGVAPEWQGASFGRGRYELTPGGGLGGSEAQLITTTQREYNGPYLHQNKIQIRKAEKLELEMWARVWHEPVTLRVDLCPLSKRSKPYDSGEITVDTPYYKRFTLPLAAPEDNDEARLSIQIIGTGGLWVDQIHLRPEGEPLLCKRVIDEMAEMRIPALRFPGGVVANAYNWQHATGPVHLRPRELDAAFHQDWYINYDFGLDEYLSLCVEQNITPTLTVNIATGTPENAGQFARYCADWFRAKEMEPPMIYWHLGCHPYIYTTASMTPEMYVGVLEAIVPEVKNNYPNSRTVAVMGYDAFSTDSPWKEALFKGGAELADVVAAQVYYGWDPTNSPESQLKVILKELETFEANTRAFIDEYRERGIQWNAGIAEWNWWKQPSHWDGRDFEEPPLMFRGFFIAGMIHRLAALSPDLEVAHFYNLVNCMGILNHRGADVEVTDPVRMFKLYRPALPGRLVPLEVELEGDGGQRSISVDALCLENDSGRWLFVINFEESESAYVSLSEFDGGAARVSGLRGEKATESFVSMSSDKISDSVEIPPLSVVRIQT